MHYLIGDLQGCCDALDRLLARIGFSASRDHLWALGDMVNRGPQSLATLRRLRAFDSSASCLLGNHDLHLLAVAHRARRLHRLDTFGDILAATDRDALLDWLGQQRLAAFDQGWLLVHAGVAPQWDLATTLSLAREVEAHLRGSDRREFLRAMYGNEPSLWQPELRGMDRLRFTVNALTRIRYCDAQGRLEFESKESVGSAPSGFIPWFDVPGRLTLGTPVAFGHWSTLGLINRPELLSLDTGCVWGGALTAVRVDSGSREVMQVPCAQEQVPGSAN